MIHRRVTILLVFRLVTILSVISVGLLTILTFQRNLVIVNMLILGILILLLCITFIMLIITLLAWLLVLIRWMCIIPLSNLCRAPITTLLEVFRVLLGLIPILITLIVGIGILILLMRIVIPLLSILSTIKPHILFPHNIRSSSWVLILLMIHLIQVIVLTLDILL